MKLGRAITLLVLALGSSACATYYDQGVSYDDGSYYSPADSGRGDYYYAPEPSYNRYYYDEFDRFFFDSSYYGFGSFGSGWYGSPIYSYGGYCSARYRYCPPFGYYDPFYDPFPRFGLSIYFGDPWYYGYGYGDGYGYGYGHGYRNPPRHRHPGNPATPPPPGSGSPASGPPSPVFAPNNPRNEEGRVRRVRPRPDPMAYDDGSYAEPGRVIGEPDDEAGDQAPPRRWRVVEPRPWSGAPGGARPPAPPRSAAEPPRERSSERSSSSDDEPPPPRRRSSSSRHDGN